jgi:peroxiredoxin
MRHPILFVCLLLAMSACTRQVVDAWPDGSLRRTGTTISGLQEGQWTYHHADGSLAAQGRFAHDLQEGPWTYHHANGSVSARGSYHLGLREGEWRWLRPDGSLERRGHYRADRQQGLWLAWDDSGQPRSAGWFAAGLADGPWWSLSAEGPSAGLQRLGQAVGPWLGLTASLPEGWNDLRSSGQGVTWHQLSDAEGNPVARLAFGPQGPLLIEDQRHGQSLAWHDDGRLALDPAGGTDRARVAAILAGREVSPPPAAPVAELAAEPGSTSMSVGTVLPIVAPIGSVEEPLLPAGSLDLSPSPALPGFWTGAQEIHAGATLARYAEGPTTDNGYFPDPQPNPGNPLWHGKAPPRTRFLGADGKVLDLAGHHGRKVALVVLRGFAGQVCLYCAGQTAALAEHRQQLAEAGIDVVVVYPGPPSSVPGFLDAVRSLGTEPELPVCLDPGLVLVRELGLLGNLARPATLLLDGQGLVRWSHVASDITDRASVQDILAAGQGLP